MMNLSTKNNHNEENEVYHHRIDFPSRTASNSFTTNTLPRTRATHEQLLLINRYVFQPLEHPPASSHNNHGTITTNNQACITSQPNIQNTFKPSTVVKHNRANKKCIPSVPKRKLKPCNDIVFEKSTKIFKFSKTSRPVKSTSNNDQNGFPQISYSSSKQHVSSFAKYKPEQHDTQLLPNQSHFENQKKTKNVFYRPNDGIQQLSTHKVGDKLGVSPVILHPNKQLSSQIQIKSEFPPAQSQRTARAGRRIVTTSLQRSTMESQNDSPIIITPSSHVIHSANEIVTANIVPKPSVPAVSHFSVVNRTGIQKLSANKVADKLGFSPVILRPNKQLTSQIQIKSEFPPAQSHRTALAGSRMVTTLLQRSAMESQNDSPIIITPSSHVIHSANEIVPANIQIKSEFPPARSQRAARAGSRMVTTSLQRSTMESQNDSPIIMTPSSHFIHSANETVPANIQIKSEFPPARSQRTARAGSRMVTTSFQRSTMESQNDSPIIMIPSSQFIHSANEAVPANIQIKSEFPPARSQRAARAGSRMVTTSLQRSTMESQNDSPIIMTPSSHFIHSANETVPANIQIKSEFPPARSQRTARAGSRMVTTSFQRSTMESQNDSPIIMIPSSQFIHSANEAVPANIQIKSEFPPARSQRAARAGSRMVTTSLQRSTMESQNDSPIIMTPSSHFIHSANETVPANIQIKSEFPPAQSQKTARPGSRLVTSFQQSTMESQNDSSILMTPSSHFIYSADEMVPANIQIKSEFPPAQSQKTAQPGSRMVTTAFQRSTMESQNDSPIIMTPSSHFIHSANEIVPANIQIKSEFPPAQSQKTAQPGSRMVTTSFQRSTMESQNDSPIIMIPSSHFIHSANETLPANIVPKPSVPAVSHFSVINNTNVQMIPSIQSTNNVKQLLWYTPASNPVSN